jgi:hypothetical protein
MVSAEFAKLQPFLHVFLTQTPQNVPISNREIAGLGLDSSPNSVKIQDNE